MQKINHYIVKHVMANIVFAQLGVEPGNFYTIVKDLRL